MVGQTSCLSFQDLWAFAHRPSGSFEIGQAACLSHHEKNCPEFLSSYSWNGTVTDTQTGLMWTKDANMLGQLNWYDAMNRCNSFNISGIGGWRLASKDELVA